MFSVQNRGKKKLDIFPRKIRGKIRYFILPFGKSVPLQRTGCERCWGDGGGGVGGRLSIIPRSMWREKLSSDITIGERVSQQIRVGKNIFFFFAGWTKLRGFHKRVTRKNVSTNLTNSCK